MGLAVLPIAGLVLTAAAAGTAAYAAHQQGEAQSKAAAYNAQMEQYNASIQKQQGQEAAVETEQQGEMIQGKARAAAAAAGLSGGSSIDIQYNDLVRNDQQANQDLYRGEIGEFNASAQANLDRYQSSYDIQAGNLNAAGALLSGAAKMTSQYSSSFGGGATGGSFSNYTTDGQPTLNG